MVSPASHRVVNCTPAHTVFKSPASRVNKVSLIVRLHKRLVKKKYYGKSTYSYEVYSLNVPREFHDLLQPFLDKDLRVDVRQERGVLTIALTPKPVSE